MTNTTNANWLVHYSMNGRKAWTVVEAKSIQEAARKVRGNLEDNLVNIIYVDLCEKDSEYRPAIQNWNSDK